MSTFLAPPPPVPVLTAAQLCQEKLSADGATEAAPAGAADILSSDGSVMQIALTPVLNCFWEVMAGMIWRNVNANWGTEYAALLLSPADVEGKTLTEGRVESHSGAGPSGYTYQPLDLMGDYKLQAGTAYVGKLRIVSAAVAWLNYYRHSAYLRLQGRTYAHGSF